MEVAVVSVFIALLAGQFGAGGAWLSVSTGMREFDYARMWSGYALLAALAAGIDLLFGGAQLVFSRPGVSP